MPDENGNPTAAELFAEMERQATQGRPEVVVTASRLTGADAVQRGVPRRPSARLAERVGLADWAPLPNPHDRPAFRRFPPPASTPPGQENSISGALKVAIKLLEKRRLNPKQALTEVNFRNFCSNVVYPATHVDLYGKLHRLHGTEVRGLLPPHFFHFSNKKLSFKTLLGMLRELLPRVVLIENRDSLGNFRQHFPTVPPVVLPEDHQPDLNRGLPVLTPDPETGHLRLQRNR